MLDTTTAQVRGHGAANAGSTATGSRGRLVPLVIAGTFFMQMLDTSILNTSLPQMAQTFGVRPLDMASGVTVYMLVFAALLPLSGWMSERFGARAVFLWAVVLFTVASLACGLSTSLTEFVVMRAFQGAGASMMTPVGRVIVLRSTTKADLLQAMATITWPALAAPLVGPLLGGFLATWASWRWNFFVNLPVGILSFASILAFVRPIGPMPGRSFDTKGFALSSTSLAALLFGIEGLARGVAHGWVSWACTAWGVAGGILAVGHLRRSRAPLLDLAPFAIDSFRLTNLSAGIWIRVAIASTPFLLPLLFQVGLGMSPLASGACLTTYFAGNLAMKTATTATLRRLGFRPVVVWNGFAVGLSLLAMIFIHKGIPTVALAIVLFAAGLVRSMQFTSLGSLSFADVPEHLSASASTLSSMTQQISMALGVTLAAGLLTASRAVGGRTGLELADFRVAFAGAAAFAFLASWRFRALPRDAGHEITGHSRQSMTISVSAPPPQPEAPRAPYPETSRT